LAATGAFLQSEIAVISGTTGSFITTSQTGQFYASNNPSSYITSLALSGYITTGNADNRYVQLGSTGGLASVANLAATGAFLQSEIVIISGTTGAFITNSQTGNFITSVSGFITTGNADIRYALASKTGTFITSAQTGGLADQNFVNTGFVASWSNETIGGIKNFTGTLQWSGNNVLTGSTGAFVVTGQTGQFFASNLTGAFYSVTNPAGYITAGQISGTGVAYVGGLTANVGITGQGNITVYTGAPNTIFISGNTGAFASLVNLAATGAFLQSEIVIISGTTGSFITTSQTGNFITSLSGYITTGNADNRYVQLGSTGGLASVANLAATGSFLQSEIVIISGTTGAFITNSQTGSFITSVSGFITTGNADIRYALAAKTGTFITSAQTGGLADQNFVNTGFVDSWSNETIGGTKNFTGILQ